MKKSRLWILLLAILAIILWGVQGTMDNVKDAVTGTVDTVGDVADGAIDVVDDAGEAIVDGAADVVEGAADIAGDAADAVGDGVEAIDDEIEEIIVEDNDEVEAEVDDANEDADVEEGNNVEEGNVEEGDDTNNNEGEAISIDLENSTVTWAGSAGPKSHEGTVDIKSADIMLTAGKVSGGIIVMDMPSIVATDIDSQGLNDHLKADDYFDTAVYPEARFEITETTDDTITGKLTIKETTAPAVISYTMGDGTIAGSLSFDSTKYGVAEGGIADALLSDNVDLEINLAY